MSEEVVKTKEELHAELMGIPYVAPVEAPAPTPKIDDVINTNLNPLDDNPAPTELSNEQLLELLNKKGYKVASLDELAPKPSEEEIRLAREKRTSDMLAFGLQTGKFKKEDYDAFQQETANKIDAIKNEMAEKLKAANPELTEAQIEEKIALYTFANLEENDVLRVQREQELIQLADSKLKNKFKNIYNLESDYDQYEQGINNKTNFERKVKAALPVYQKDVASVLSGLRTLDVPVNDTKNPENDHTVKLNFSDADLKELEDLFLEPDEIIRQVRNGYTVEQLKDVAETALVKKHFPRLVSQAAKDYNSVQKDKYIQGRKGLIPGPDSTLDISDADLTESKQKMYEELQQSMPS